ncbi:MAG: TIGR03905 family TSCPD domain-containing protein [Candidatus Scatovivens sp.]
MTYEIEPIGVCSIKIEVTINNDIIEDVNFVGGCPGNTLGLATLLQGMKVQDAIKKLKGIECGSKGTSCPDQLASGLEKILNEKNQ